MALASGLLRQWTLLRAIASGDGQVTVKSLVDRSGVSEKTIRRDLSVLKRAGFPLSESVGRHGCKTFRLAATDLPRLEFSYDEALALFFCQRALLPLSGTFFWQSAQRALQKVRASLGTRIAGYLDRMLPRVHQTVTEGAYRSKAELIDRLVIAVEECKVAVLTYQSSRSTEARKYKVEPYGLIDHRGSLYLVGYSRHHQALRRYVEAPGAKARLRKNTSQARMRR